MFDFFPVIVLGSTAVEAPPTFVNNTRVHLLNSAAFLNSLIISLKGILFCKAKEIGSQLVRLVGFEMANVKSFFS